MLWYIIVILSFSCQSYLLPPYNCTHPTQRVVIADHLEEALRVISENTKEEILFYKCDDKECTQMGYELKKEPMIGRMPSLIPENELDKQIRNSGKVVLNDCVKEEPKCYCKGNFLVCEAFGSTWIQLPPQGRCSK